MGTPAVDEDLYQKLVKFTKGDEELEVTRLRTGQYYITLCNHVPGEQDPLVAGIYLTQEEFDGIKEQLS